MALLYVLNELRVKLNISLIVAHLNHGIRGRASDADEQFVRKVCQGLGIEHVTKKLTLFKRKAKTVNEASLRDARLHFLSETAKEIHADKIALGHTLDDQAETVLMRLMRGSGLHGVIAMKVKRRIDSCVIVRPLLSSSRAEVVKYLKTKKVVPRFDATNKDNVFLRNKIRNVILPQIKRENPNIVEVLARFAQQAAVDYDFLEQQAAAFIKRESAVSFSIQLREFLGQHEALQRMMIRCALEQLTGSLRTFTFAHWEQIQQLLRQEKDGGCACLTRDAVIKKNRGKIIIFLKKVG